MLAVFDNITFIVIIWDKLASKGVCHGIGLPYDWLMYDYYGLLVTLSNNVLIKVTLSRQRHCRGTGMVLFGTLWFAVYWYTPLSTLKIPLSQKGSNAAGRSGEHCKVPQQGFGAQPRPQTHLDIFWTRKTCLVTCWFFLYGPKCGN